MPAGLSWDQLGGSIISEIEAEKKRRRHRMIWWFSGICFIVISAGIALVAYINSDSDLVTDHLQANETEQNISQTTVVQTKELKDSDPSAIAQDGNAISEKGNITNTQENKGHFSETAPTQKEINQKAERINNPSISAAKASDKLKVASPVITNTKIDSESLNIISDDELAAVRQLSTSPEANGTQKEKETEADPLISDNSKTVADNSKDSEIASESSIESNSEGKVSQNALADNSSTENKSVKESDSNSASDRKKNTQRDISSIAAIESMILFLAMEKPPIAAAAFVRKDLNDHVSLEEPKKKGFQKISEISLSSGISYLKDSYSGGRVDNRDLNTLTESYESVSGVNVNLGYRGYISDKIFLETGLNVAQNKYLFDHTSTRSADTTLQNVLTEIRVNNVTGETEDIYTDPEVTAHYSVRIKQYSEIYSLELPLRIGITADLGKLNLSVATGLSLRMIIASDGIGQNTDYSYSDAENKYDPGLQLGWTADGRLDYEIGSAMRLFCSAGLSANVSDIIKDQNLGFTNKPVSQRINFGIALKL